MHVLFCAVATAFILSGTGCDAAAPAPVRIGKIVWQTDYDAALKMAQKEKKPLWLHFGENPG